jgi:hypothetical protein
MSLDIYFISEQTIKDKTGVSNAVDGKQLKPAIKIAQDIFLQPALGSSLYNRLQSGVQSNNLNSNEINLLDNYIIDCLVWATMANLSHLLSYQMFAKGIHQKSAEDSVLPTKNEIDAIETRYKDYAEYYKDRLIKFLRANCNTFPTYLNGEIAIDTIYPTKDAYECPIFIGSGKKVANYDNFTSNAGAILNSSLKTARYVATGGETSFTVTASNFAIGTVYLAFRSGIKKDLVSIPTTDTEKLQRVAGVITLPTGDVATSGEVFEFLYV